MPEVEQELEGPVVLCGNRAKAGVGYLPTTEQDRYRTQYLDRGPDVAGLHLEADRPGLAPQGKGPLGGHCLDHAAGSRGPNLDRLGEHEGGRRIGSDVHDPAAELRVPLAEVALYGSHLYRKGPGDNVGTTYGDRARYVRSTAHRRVVLAEEHLFDPVAHH